MAHLWLESNPPLPVHVFGLRSDTHTLGRCGWKLAIQREHAFDSVQVMLHHPASGLTLMAQIRDFELASRQFRSMNDYGALPVIVVSHVVIRDQGDFRFVGHHPPDMSWRQTDPVAIPLLQETSLFDLPLFRELDAPAGEQLIVEPATVAELLDQIRRMQAPEQAAIRERQRQRERAAPHRLHAQILSIAA